MYTYSVTLQIDTDAEQEWLDFMQHKHIDDVLNAGYFKSCTMRKVIYDTESGSVTYNMHYEVESFENYNAYMQNAAPSLQKNVADRFNGKFSAQRTLYKTVLFKSV